MTDRYLEITYRHGRPLAAYLYLEREPRDRAARTEPAGDFLLIDFSVDGRPIGIEITSPRMLKLADLNELLIQLHQQPADAAELQPLAAA